MTKNQKIAIGLGALALGYWLYTKNKEKKSVEAPATPSAPQNTGDTPCPQGQVLETINCITTPCPPPRCVDIPKTEPRYVKTPTGLGGIVPPNTYRLKQDFSQKFPIGASGSGAKTFKKGDVIRALKNPYLAQVHAVGKGTLTTTVEGNQPNFNSEGQIWINIPESILEKL